MRGSDERGRGRDGGSGRGCESGRGGDGGRGLGGRGFEVEVVGGEEVGRDGKNSSGLICGFRRITTDDVIIRRGIIRVCPAPPAMGMHNGFRMGEEGGRGGCNEALAFRIFRAEIKIINIIK